MGGRGGKREGGGGQHCCQVEGAVFTAALVSQLAPVNSILQKTHIQATENGA
jgi:hypothetical protein